MRNDIVQPHGSSPDDSCQLFVQDVSFRQGGISEQLHQLHPVHCVHNLISEVYIYAVTQQQATMLSVLYFSHRLPRCHRLTAGASITYRQRSWLVFPMCPDVSFLSHCTNDSSTAGGARRCGATGAREWRCCLGKHHLLCGMPGCVRTAAKPHLS